MAGLSNVTISSIAEQHPPRFTHVAPQYHCTFLPRCLRSRPLRCQLQASCKTEGGLLGGFWPEPPWPWAWPHLAAPLLLSTTTQDLEPATCKHIRTASLLAAAAAGPAAPQVHSQRLAHSYETRQQHLDMHSAAAEVCKHTCVPVHTGVPTQAGRPAPPR